MMPFWFIMGWRELRSAWRHFLYFLACIALGVGAVVGSGRICARAVARR